MGSTFDRHQIVTCRCCGRPYSLAAWQALDLCGYLDPAVAGVRLEQRDCVCGSTQSAPMAGGRYLTAAEYAAMEGACL